MSLLTDALSYAQRGWPIILVYGLVDGQCTCPKGALCDHKGKHAVPGCSQRHATTDPQTIEGWLRLYERLNPNIGILTGVSSGILVIDIDPRSGGDETWTSITEGKQLPTTLVANTGGGGEHYYFQCPTEFIIHTSIGVVGKGIDVKANSKEGKNPGYVLVPPSVTVEKYAWRNPDSLIAKVPDWLLELMVFKDEAREQKFEGVEVIKEGSRHDFILQRAGKLKHDNWSSESILQALITENLTKCQPPLSEDEIKQIAQGILSYSSPLFRLNDVGNAKRLVFKFGNQLRYCWQQKIWYIWEGRYWARDVLGQIHQFAKATVEWMHQDALLKTGDIGPQLRKHASQSGRAEKIRSMVEMSTSEKEVSVKADDLDSYPLLLNCPNGTLDLSTGKLHAHDSKQLMTKITTTNYIPSATSKLWEQFMKETTDSDEELQTFMQRVSGYALSGLTVEEYIFFVQGVGGTGKSTYFETIKAIMGPGYCKTASFDTFIKNKNGGGNAPRSDIARLPGARLVTAVETQEGKQFASDLLKVTTGGDTITTRDLYASDFEFVPQFKLWLAANSKPRIREDDTGMWRRILLIPFNHVVHTPNKKLKEVLRASAKDREGILAWMVRGFLDWQKYGWTIPNVVLKETKVYKSEMDSLNAWLEDCCQKEAGQYASFRDLWDSYDVWMKKQPQSVRDGRIETTKGFASELQKRGLISDLKNVSGKAIKVYNGIMIIY